MPSGKTHLIITAAITTVGGVSLLGWSGDQMICASGFIAGGLAGMILTPDLDIPTNSISKNVARKWFGKAGHIWGLFWLPYALIIPHRSAFSHFPIIGTVGRLLYLSMPVGLLAMIVRQTFTFTLPSLINIPMDTKFLGYALASLIISDSAHYLADKLMGKGRVRWMS
jgi:uncharacterized metal-binding protein